MSVYVAYSDEAATAGADGEFLVAGYIAAETEWPSIEIAWQDRVPDGPPTIPYLHMTEVRSSAWRTQHGISYYQAEQRVDEAVRVLYSMGSLCAYSSGVNRAELRNTVQAKYTKARYIPTGIDQPDYLCFSDFAEDVLKNSRYEFSDIEKIDFVISEKQCVSKNMHQVLDIVKARISDPAVAALVGCVRIEQMKTCLPLQAADVLCWHLQRYFSGSFNRTEENRMWYLLKERTGFLRRWKRDELESVSRDLEMTGQT